MICLISAYDVESKYYKFAEYILSVFVSVSHPAHAETMGRKGEYL